MENYKRCCAIPPNPPWWHWFVDLFFKLVRQWWKYISGVGVAVFFAALVVRRIAPSVSEGISWVGGMSGAIDLAPNTWILLTLVRVPGKVISASPRGTNMQSLWDDEAYAPPDCTTDDVAKEDRAICYATHTIKWCQAMVTPCLWLGAACFFLMLKLCNYVELGFMGVSTLVCVLCKGRGPLSQYARASSKYGVDIPFVTCLVCWLLLCKKGPVHSLASLVMVACGVVYFVSILDPSSIEVPQSPHSDADEGDSEFTSRDFWSDVYSDLRSYFPTSWPWQS
jgi:hypothetical protein